MEAQFLDTQVGQAVEPVVQAEETARRTRTSAWAISNSERLGAPGGDKPAAGGDHRAAAGQNVGDSRARTPGAAHNFGGQRMTGPQRRPARCVPDCSMEDACSSKITTKRQ